MVRCPRCRPPSPTTSRTLSPNASPRTHDSKTTHIPCTQTRAHIPMALRNQPMPASLSTSAAHLTLLCCMCDVCIVCLAVGVRRSCWSTRSCTTRPTCTCTRGSCRRSVTRSYTTSDNTPTVRQPTLSILSQSTPFIPPCLLPLSSLPPDTLLSLSLCPFFPICI